MGTMGALAYCKILSAWLRPVNKDQRHSKHHRYKSSFRSMISSILSMYEFEELSGSFKIYACMTPLNKEYMYIVS